MLERRKLLKKLLKYDGNLKEITTSLEKLGWDSNVSLITLQRQEIIEILNRYIKSEFTTSDIEEWANAIEGREDIDYENGYDELISTIIFKLANPLLTQGLDPQVASEIINSLTKKPVIP